MDPRKCLGRQRAEAFARALEIVGRDVARTDRKRFVEAAGLDWDDGLVRGAAIRWLRQHGLYTRAGNMERTVGSVGTSVYVTIPAVLVDEYDVCPGTRVRFERESRRALRLIVLGHGAPPEEGH